MMNIKSTILYFSLGAGLTFFSGNLVAQEESKFQPFGKKEASSGKPIGHDRNTETPKRLNEDIMDNGKKRTFNADAKTDKVGTKKKYTRTKNPVDNQRYDASSFAKPTKWIRKRLPDVKDVGRDETSTLDE